MQLDARAAALAAVGFTMLLAGLLAGQPAAAALGCALFAPLALAATLPRPDAVELTFAVNRLRLLEGDEITGTLTIEAKRDARWVELELPSAAGVRLVAGERSMVIALRAGERRVVSYRLSFERWGVYQVGAVTATTRGGLGLRAATSRVAGQTIRVFPSPERLSRLVSPASTRPVSGSQRSRRKGDGFEFADLRPYQVGDRMQRINWRQSARRSTLVVAERTPEESADVVIFLDAYAEARDDDGGTLDEIVRAAAALARAYMNRHDRVGLISFSGDVQWLRPASGRRHGYQVAAALLESEIGRSLRWHRVDVIPRRTLPAHALVVALTPLLDERTNRALFDLRARDYDLSIVEVDPVPYLGRHRHAVGDEAWRLWLGWRDVIRGRFGSVGAPVTTWQPGQPLDPVIREALRSRRAPHKGRAR